VGAPRARAEHNAAGGCHLERHLRPGRVVRAGANGALQAIGLGSTCWVQGSAAHAAFHGVWHNKVGLRACALTRSRRPQFLADFGHIVLARGGRAALLPPVCAQHCRVMSHVRPA
jgi:hypothetical protein